MPASRGTRARSSGQLATINPNAAGLDVGSTFHVVAVPADRDEQPVRTFRTFSGDLHRLADWLEATGITTVAMDEGEADPLLVVTDGAPGLIAGADPRRNGSEERRVGKEGGTGR